MRMFWLPWRSLMAQSSLIDFSSPGGFEPLGQKKGSVTTTGKKRKQDPQEEEARRSPGKGAMRHSELGERPHRVGHLLGGSGMGGINAEGWA